MIQGLLHLQKLDQCLRIVLSQIKPDLVMLLFFSSSKRLIDFKRYPIEVKEVIQCILFFFDYLK